MEVNECVFVSRRRAFVGGYRVDTRTRVGEDRCRCCGLVFLTMEHIMKGNKEYVLVFIFMCCVICHVCSFWGIALYICIARHLFVVFSTSSLLPAISGLVCNFICIIPDLTGCGDSNQHLFHAAVPSKFFLWPKNAPNIFCLTTAASVYFLAKVRY